jgi:hypothetical protein
VAFVAALAAAQIRHRPGRWALLALGVALAAAIPIISAGTGGVVAAQNVRRSVGQLAPGDRSITVTEHRSIFDKSSTSEIDEFVRVQLADLSSAAVRRELVYRQLTLSENSFFLVGTDDLSTAVRLVDGRMPASCTPTRCEVVMVGAGDEQTLARAAAPLGVVVVGRATRRDPLLATGTFDTAGVPLLVGDGADKLALLSSLNLFDRTYGWVVALDLDRLVRMGVAQYVQRSDAIADAITAKLPGATIYRPDASLLQQDRRAALSSRRFGLLGGSAAVLLLGFALLAAVGLRRDHGLLVTVLRRRGASRAQVGRLTVLQVLLTCVIGAVIGCGLAVAVTAVLAHSASLPVARTSLAAVRSGAGGTALLVLAAAAVAVIALLWPDSAGRAVWQGLDLVALACLGAAALAADRGSASTSSLAASADPLVVLLPVLAAVTGGLIAARLWSPVARLVERSMPRRSVLGRIALLGAVRRPLRFVATTGFLTAAVAAVVFAGAYRSTLLAGAADQAAYQVPLDETLASSPDDVTPLAVTSGPKLAAIAAGVDAYPVVRTAASVHTAGGDSTSVPVVGLDPGALSAMHRWTRTTGSTVAPASLAARLGASAAATGPTFPARTGSLAITAAGLRPEVQVSLTVATSDGRENTVTLAGHGAMLSGTVPDLGAAPHVVAISLREDPDYATHREHALGEGNTDQPVLAGNLVLSKVSANGAPLGWDWSRWTAASAEVAASSSQLHVSYRLADSTAVLWPGPPIGSLPVAVDPQTAQSAEHGRLLVTIGQATLATTVVGILPRLPTVDGPFLLADRAAISAVLDRGQPGTGGPLELWVGSPSASRAALDRALAAAPYDRLTVTSRAAVQRDLTSDPVGRGSRLLLAVVAGLALLVAAASLVLLIVGERRDGAGELFAWESDGLAPAALRRIMFLRAMSVIAVAVPLGLATGLILAGVGVRLVAVDASGATPVPPLQTSIGLGGTALVLVVAVSVAALLVAGVVAQSLRERLPVRPDVELR